MEKGLFNLVFVSMHAWRLGPEHLSASQLRRTLVLTVELYAVFEKKNCML